MIVGIGSQARVGKDVAASALCRDLGYTRVGFADKLKELAYAIDPIVTSNTQATNIGAGKGRLAWMVDGMSWEEAKSVYPEVRRVLQELGVGARNVFGDDFWINQALGKRPSGLTVVPDVRFVNEAEEIARRGGRLIKITRPGAPPVRRHQSETDLNDWDGWDAVIVNDGSINDFENKVVTTVKGWLDESAARQHGGAD